MISSRSCATRKRCLALASLKSANRTVTRNFARRKLLAPQLRQKCFQLDRAELQHAAIIPNIERKSFLPRNHRARPRLGQKFFRPFAIGKQPKFLPPNSKPLPQQHRGQRGHVARTSARPKRPMRSRDVRRCRTTRGDPATTKNSFSLPAAISRKPGFAASVPASPASANLPARRTTPSQPRAKLPRSTRANAPRRLPRRTNPKTLHQWTPARPTAKTDSSRQTSAPK